MIQINIINIIGVAVLANMFVHWYSPIQRPKRYVLKFLPSIVQDALSCTKCTSFLFGIFIFLDIFAAAFTALVGFFIGWLIDYINEYYE